jgi:hypothetical protein
MDAIAGVSCTRVYRLVINGLPQTGASLTYSLWDPEGAVALAAVAVTDVGDGTYTRAIDGTDDIPTPGTYREQWLGSYAGLDLQATGPVLVGSDAGDTVTRREIRWDAARQLDDLWLGTVTVSSFVIGVATYLTVPELVAATNEWKGHELYVYAGTGRGEARQIIASGDQDGEITTLVWTTQPAAGSAIEAHKRFRVDQYNAAITRAIRQARGVWIEMEDRSLLQVSGQYEYAVPAGLVWLASVETQDAADTDQWTPLFRDTREWEAWPGTLRLPNGGSTDVRMRLKGWRRPQRLDYDEQYTDIDPAYLVDATVGLLAASEVRAPALDRQAAAQSAAYWQTLAGAQIRRSALQDAVRVGA